MNDQIAATPLADRPPPTDAECALEHADKMWDAEVDNFKRFAMRGRLVVASTCALLGFIAIGLVFAGADITLNVVYDEELRTALALILGFGAVVIAVGLLACVHAVVRYISHDEETSGALTNSTSFAKAIPIYQLIQPNLFTVNPRYAFLSYARARYGVLRRPFSHAGVLLRSLWRVSIIEWSYYSRFSARALYQHAADTSKPPRSATDAPTGAPANDAETTPQAAGDGSASASRYSYETEPKMIDRIKTTLRAAKPKDPPRRSIFLRVGHMALFFLSTLCGLLCPGLHLPTRLTIHLHRCYREWVYLVQQDFAKRQRESLETIRHRAPRNRVDDDTAFPEKFKSILNRVTQSDPVFMSTFCKSASFYMQFSDEFLERHFGTVKRVNPSGVVGSDAADMSAVTGGYFEVDLSKDPSQGEAGFTQISWRAFVSRYFAAQQLRSMNWNIWFRVRQAERLFVCGLVLLSFGFIVVAATGAKIKQFAAPIPQMTLEPEVTSEGTRFILQHRADQSE